MRVNADPTGCIVDPQIRSLQARYSALTIEGTASGIWSATAATITRFRLQPVHGAAEFTMTSSAASAERNAARKSAAKKIGPKNAPPGIAAKTRGRVKKRSGGPAAGATESANAAGITASPPRIAAPESPRIVEAASFRRSAVRGR